MTSKSSISAAPPRSRTERPRPAGALGEAEGSLLAFLPGVAEIERTAARLDPLPAGRPAPARQPRSRRPARRHRRVAAGAAQLVLATSIAETSLTLDGVRIVVDSGLARRPRYDRGAGLTRLVTERASQAAITQRAGAPDAGRQDASIACGRKRRPRAHRADPPEILEADLSALLLDCALWGVADPRRLRWLDPPPAAALDEGAPPAEPRRDRRG